MNKPHILLILTGLFLMTACGAQPQAEFSEFPAKLSNHSNEVVAEISETVASLLDKESVQIAKQPFAESDLLVVHRAMLMGREMDSSVNRFRLVKQGDTCILFHENSGNHRSLKNASCEPLTTTEQ